MRIYKNFRYELEIGSRGTNGLYPTTIILLAPKKDYIFEFYLNDTYALDIVRRDRYIIHILELLITEYTKQYDTLRSL